jgi:hypothetical protein
LVAVAGHPQRADQLEPVAAATGVDERVVPLLREAVDAAVLAVGDDDTYWFVHPLLAEVLERGLLPEEGSQLDGMPMTLRLGRACSAVGAEERFASPHDCALEEPLTSRADQHFEHRFFEPRRGSCTGVRY